MAAFLRSDAPESRRPPPSVDDSVEVPAAVVCALCGDAECAGCEQERSRSGVVALVAWERPGAPVLRSLWATARASTLEGEAFFELLPDGPIAPALRFALLTETLAAMGFVLLAVPLLLVLAPDWVRHVASDAAAREAAVRIVALAVPGLALMLVAAHAAHGFALDRGARASGGRAAPWRALRFGLYATGWDLVLGPIGAVVVARTCGVGRAFGLFRLGVGLPGRCTRAFLRGCHRLEGARAEKASRVATAAAIVATLVGAIGVLGVALVLALV